MSIIKYIFCCCVSKTNSQKTKNIITYEQPIHGVNLQEDTKKNIANVTTEKILPKNQMTYYGSIPTEKNTRLISTQQFNSQHTFRSRDRHYTPTSNTQEHKKSHKRSTTLDNFLRRKQNKSVTYIIPQFHAPIQQLKKQQRDSGAFTQNNIQSRSSSTSPFRQRSISI